MANKGSKATCFFSVETKVHSSPLTCVAAHQDNNLLLTGSEDCTACLIDTHSKKVVKNPLILSCIIHNYYKQVLCKFEPGPVGDKYTIETVGFCQV